MSQPEIVVVVDTDDGAVEMAAETDFQNDAVDEIADPDDMADDAQFNDHDWLTKSLEGGQLRIREMFRDIDIVSALKIGQPQLVADDEIQSADLTKWALLLHERYPADCRLQKMDGEKHLAPMNQQAVDLAFFIFKTRVLPLVDAKPKGKYARFLVLLDRWYGRQYCTPEDNQNFKTWQYKVNQEVAGDAHSKHSDDLPKYDRHFRELFVADAMKYVDAYYNIINKSIYFLIHLFCIYCV